MKIQVLPPDVNESSANFTPVGNDIRFGLTAIRNVGDNVVDGIVAAREREGPLRRLQRLPGQGPRAGLQQAGHRVADQGRRVRRHEAPAPGAGGDPRAGRRPVRRHQAQRGDRPGLAVRRHRRRRRRRLRRHRRDPRASRSGTRRPCSATSARCSASTSPTTRCSASSTCSRSGTDCTIGQLMLDEERADGRPLTVSGLVTSVQRKITKRGDAWAMVTSRTSTARSRCCCSPAPTSWPAPCSSRTPSSRVKGALSRDKDQPELRGPGGHRPRPVRRAQRAGRDQPAVDPLHAAGGGPAQRRARHPPWGHRGPAATLVTRDATTVMRLDDRLRVTPSPALFADLKQLLGPGCLTG